MHVLVSDLNQYYPPRKYVLPYTILIIQSFITNLVSVVFQIDKVMNHIEIKAKIQWKHKAWFMSYL